jgi:argininosuccinate lyase
MELPQSVEDVHAAVEEKVIAKVGAEIGGNLHIAKSRNDQVSTAIRMELREVINGLMSSIIELQEALAELAEQHVETIFPGYTHMQPAQPVTFAHYLLSCVDVLERDKQRLEEAQKRVNLCPMGAGALATTSFQISRERVAELLGFSEVLENSIDAVGSRDFILETMADLTIIAVNISRLAEDLIVWSSTDFSLIELPDNFSSTSSIMPQKKNPDTLEVIRARASHVIGNFVTSAATMKAMPSSYNLDFQEITPRLWESTETIFSCLDMLSKLIPNLKVLNKTLLSFTTATELANMLVRKYNVPFRTAHKIVGALVRALTEAKLSLTDTTPELLEKVAKDSAGLKLNVNAEDLRESTDLSKLVEAYKVRGGPSPVEVKRMLKIRKQRIASSKSNLSEKQLQLKEAENKLQSIAKSYSSSMKPVSTKFKNTKGDVR